MKRNFNKLSLYKIYYIYQIKKSMKEKRLEAQPIFFKDGNKISSVFYVGQSMRQGLRFNAHYKAKNLLTSDINILIFRIKKYRC